MNKLLGIMVLATTLLSAVEIGVVKQATGVVKIKRLKEMLIIKNEDKVYKNDTIITKEKSSVCIVLTNGKVVTLGENSILPIKKHLSSKEDEKEYFSMNI